METLTVSDLITTYSKFIEEAIQDYTEKNKNSSIPAKNVNLLTQHVVTYCRDKTADLLLQIPQCHNGSERRQEILEEETDFEQEKCMEPMQMHQSSPAPSEIKETSKEAEIRQEFPEEKKSFEQGKCMETAEINQSSSDPSKVIVDGDLFMKLMNEHHKQQQEFQDKIITTLLDQLDHQHIQQEQNIQQQKKVYEQVLQQQKEFQDKTFKTLLDQLEHQHTRQEQNQQQQNNVYTQLFQQQQDFQSRLMGDFMKHSKLQVTLFCQALSNGKTEQPVSEDHHINVGEKPQDTLCYQPSNSERTYNSSTGHNSIFGQGAAERSASFGHFGVAKRDKQAFQVFDCHELGQEFCKWFYRQLNCQNPTYGLERLDWDPNMFWNDVKFTLAHDDLFEEYTGDECVREKLLEMSQVQKLTFTPELDSERFKCVNSRHGLVVVAVTGVISNNGERSGVFRQVFGLIKCPTIGSYKIKTITLRMRNMNPFISKSTFCAPLLEYTTEQLQDFEIQSSHQYL